MSADRIHFDFVQMDEYIKHTKKQCGGMSERQAAIETAYRRLGENWIDDIYARAGEILTDTARNVKKIYDELRVSASEVVKLFNDLCDYNNCSNRMLSVKIDDLTVKVAGGKNMQNAITSDPEVLYSFMRQLKSYIIETQNAVRAIKRKHEDMARYWQGKQYNSMTRCLDETGRQIFTQLETLEYLLEYIRRKYVKLCEASRIAPKSV